MSEERPSKCAKKSSETVCGDIHKVCTQKATTSAWILVGHDESAWVDFFNNIPIMIDTIKGLFKTYYRAGRVVIDTNSFQSELQHRLIEIQTEVIKLHDLHPLFLRKTDKGWLYLPKSVPQERLEWLDRLVSARYIKSEDTTLSELITQNMNMLKYEAKKMYRSYFKKLHGSECHKVRIDDSRISIYNFPVEIISIVLSYCPKADPFLPAKIMRLSKWFNTEFGDPIFVYQSYLSAIEDMKFNLLYNLSISFKLVVRPVGVNLNGRIDKRDLFLGDDNKLLLRFSHFAGQIFKNLNKQDSGFYTIDDVEECYNVVAIDNVNSYTNRPQVQRLYNALSTIGKREYVYSPKSVLIHFGSDIRSAREAMDTIMDFLIDDKYPEHKMVFGLTKDIATSSNTHSLVESLQNFYIEDYEYYIFNAMTVNESTEGEIEMVITRGVLNSHVGSMMTKFHSGEYKPSLFYTTTACSNPYTVWFKGTHEFDWYEFNSMLGFYDFTSLCSRDIEDRGVKSPLKWNPIIDLGWNREYTIFRYNAWKSKYMPRDEEIPTLRNKIKNRPWKVTTPTAIHHPFIDQSVFVPRGMLNIIDAMEHTVHRNVQHMTWIKDKPKEKKIKKKLTMWRNDVGDSE